MRWDPVYWAPQSTPAVWEAMPVLSGLEQRVVEERQRTGFAQPEKAKGGLTSLAVPHGKAAGKMSL